MAKVDLQEQVKGINKIMAVINSCETLEQIMAADRMRHNYSKVVGLHPVIGVLYNATIVMSKIKTLEILRK